MITALFIGGPENGELRSLRNAERHIKIPSMDRINYYVPEEIDPLGTATFTVHTYTETILSFFGNPLRVYVHQSLHTGPLGDKQVGLLVLQAVMNDLGKNLLSEMQ